MPSLHAILPNWRYLKYFSYSGGCPQGHFARLPADPNTEINIDIDLATLTKVANSVFEILVMSSSQSIADGNFRRRLWQASNKVSAWPVQLADD